MHHRVILTKYRTFTSFCEQPLKFCVLVGECGVPWIDQHDLRKIASSGLAISGSPVKYSALMKCTSWTLLVPGDVPRLNRAPSLLVDTKDSQSSLDPNPVTASSYCMTNQGDQGTTYPTRTIALASFKTHGPWLLLSSRSRSSREEDRWVGWVQW